MNHYALEQLDYESPDYEQTGYEQKLKSARSVYERSSVNQRFKPLPYSTM